MNIERLIKLHRVQLGKTQEQYGKLFGVHGVAVSLWESGSREAPYRVIESVFEGLKVEPKEVMICPRCGGTGICEKFVADCSQPQSDKGGKE